MSDESLIDENSDEEEIFELSFVALSAESITNFRFTVGSRRRRNCSCRYVMTLCCCCHWLHSTEIKDKFKEEPEECI